MKKGITPIVSMMLLLLITVAIVGSAYIFISSSLTAYSDKLLASSTRRAQCSGDSVQIKVSNVGAGDISAAEAPVDFSGIENLVKNSGFEYEIIPDEWEMPKKDIDVILLLDRSLSMVRGESGSVLCKTPCDVLGYSASEAYCSGETYPDCEDCDGRNPSLSLERRRDDTYYDHSVPGNLHYEDCPYNQEKVGAIGFINLMDPSDDRVGIISFSGPDSDYASGDILADLELPFTYDYTSAVNIIDQMYLGDRTGITAAIRYARVHFNDNPRDSRKIIVLLTDGEETLGGEVYKDVESSTPLNEANSAYSEGIKIYTIGFGDNADETVLQQIADATGGSYHFAATGQDLAGIYENIAYEISAYIDNTKSRYGKNSARFPASNGTFFYSVPFELSDMDYLVTQYVKLGTLNSGSVSISLMLYPNLYDAQNHDEDNSIEIARFSAPLADMDFTKHKKIILSEEFDDECQGDPCNYGRLKYEWSSGSPEGIIWIDDVFIGPYLAYLDTIEYNEARLGDITVLKNGEGDLYPYVSSSVVKPNGELYIKDLNCAGDFCEYHVLTRSSTVDMRAFC
jgi:hypothetical protein